MYKNNLSTLCISKNSFSISKPANVEIKDLEINYLIPQNISNSNELNGLSFSENSWDRETTQDKILVKYDDNTLQIEKRTDNGSVSSGRIYTVEIIRNSKSNSEI